MKNDKKTFIPWLISIVVSVLCILAVVLSAAGLLTLGDMARNVLALTVTAALIVFGYTSCKFAGILKGQKK